MSILDIVGSIVSGGATGLIGIALGGVTDWLKAKAERETMALRFQNDQAMLRLQGELQDKEWAHRTVIAQTEAESAKDTADGAAFAASFQMEPRSYVDRIKPTWGQAWVLVLLEAARGIVRPALTVYLCILTTLIYWQAEGLLRQENLSASQALDIEQQVISTVLYLTTTCLLWWFGTRSQQSAPSVRR